MAKPRIIIADTDLSYIIPLQLKFLEEFFNKVDLEIITDEEYFKNLFLEPQSADILIVSEEFYDSSLKKHNISNLFLMMEQYEEGKTDELNINRLFKYTSIKEIFNKITAKSARKLNINEIVKKESQVVLVCSACGGVGKTTVSLGISASLTKNYKKVLYINAGRLQSFHRILKNQSVISSADIYAKLVRGNENIYSDIKHVLRKETFSYLPPFKAALMSLGLTYSIYEKIVTSAKKSNDYDYIVIDADTAFDEDNAKLLNISDKVIVVNEQTSTSIFATNILVDNINGTNSDKYIFVCNNFNKNENNAIVTSNIPLKFIVNEYIEHFDNYDQLNCEDLSKDTGIQKTAFLVI
ncbi:AAA family ATPase [Clostridium nigeriense]|mgnify:CR=1 FL=1|uniref:AAA family ATPase n=1 Tax=Clostridium nigeriense TaxID=1805470 RepID=UPI0008310BC7|nr:AAA family ATPase [Clostridium nigeriense]